LIEEKCSSTIHSSLHVVRTILDREHLMKLMNVLDIFSVNKMTHK